LADDTFPPPPEGTPAGWYWDSAATAWRWWTGLAWTNWTSPGPQPPNQNVARIFANDRLAAVARVVLSAGVIVAATVLITSLAINRRIPAAIVLLILGIPVLAAGQLWAILTLGGPGLTRTSRRQRRSISPIPHSVFAFFQRVPVVVTAFLIAGMILGWITVMSSFGPLGGGQPIRGGPNCPYGLNDHGSVTCVSKSTFDQAVVAGQRAAAGVFLGLFSFQCLATWSDVARRQRPQPA
jgi:hypothetical protein